MPARARKNTEPPTEDRMEDAYEGVNQTVEVTGAGTWYEGFDQEEFPDAVSVGEDEMLFFKLLEDNVVPLETQSGDVVDTPVWQIVVMPGTTVTEKTLDGTDYVSTGKVVPVGEVRSLWLSTKLLVDAFEEWEAAPDDEGVVKYAGKVTSKRKREYQKWFTRFNKIKPRRTPAR